MYREISMHIENTIKTQRKSLSIFLSRVNGWWDGYLP